MNSIKPTKQEILDLYNNGVTIDKMLNSFRCRRTTLYKWFGEYGIQFVPYFRRRIYPTICENVKQIILGTLLGDASIVIKGPQARLSISHSTMQDNYVRHIESVLGALCCGVYDVVNKEHTKHDGTIIKTTAGLLLQSKVHPYFLELRERIYIDGRKTVTEQWLNQVTEVGLAYFFMDDGSSRCNVRGIKRVYEFHTQSYNDNERALICGWLLRFGIDAWQSKRKSIVLSMKSDDRFVKLVEPFIIESMRYKLFGKPTQKTCRRPNMDQNDSTPVRETDPGEIRSEGGKTEDSSSDSATKACGVPPAVDKIAIERKGGG